MASIINATTTNGVVASGDNSGSLQLATNNGTTAVTIDTSQNVGVGTASPQARLHQSSTNDGVQAIFTGAQTATTQSILLRSQYQTNNGTAGFANIGWFDNGSQGGGLTFGTTSNGSGTTGIPTERMRINSSGQVTMPYQPAFLAYNSVSVTTTSQNPFQVSDVVYNTGSHYNSSTYRFTAPISGKYWFSAAGSFWVNGSARQITMQLRVNGGSYISSDCHITQAQSNNTHSVAPLSAILNLTAGDYVDLAWEGSTATVTLYVDNRRCYFSGYLIG
jgi:hypothetical protein